MLLLAWTNHKNTDFSSFFFQNDHFVTFLPKWTLFGPKRGHFWWSKSGHFWRAKRGHFLDKNVALLWTKKLTILCPILEHWGVGSTGRLMCNHPGYSDRWLKSPWRLKSTWEKIPKTGDLSQWRVKSMFDFFSRCHLSDPIMYIFRWHFYVYDDLERKCTPQAENLVFWMHELPWKMYFRTCEGSEMI